MADGVNQTDQKGQRSQCDDHWKQETQQLVKVAHVRRKENAGASTFRVETIDKPCAARQEEEYDDRGVKVGLSLFDHDGSKRCAITTMLGGIACSLYKSNAHTS